MNIPNYYFVRQVDCVERGKEKFEMVTKKTARLLRLLTLLPFLHTTSVAATFSSKLVIWFVCLFVMEEISQDLAGLQS